MNFVTEMIDPCPPDGTSVIPEHCTDASCAGLMGHNEDGYIANGRFSYLAEVAIAGRKTVWGFCYPGQLIGNAFAMNSAGLVLTINYIFITDLYNGTDGVPINFVTNAAVQAESVADAERILTSDKLIAGVSVNLGQMHADAPADCDFEQRNLELSRAQEEVGRELLGESATRTLAHFNMFHHSCLDRQFQCTSSLRRRAAAAALGPTRTRENILALLSNRDDNEFPIYRDGQPSGVDTITTVLFDLRAETATVFTGKPTDGATFEAPRPKE